MMESNKIYYRICERKNEKLCTLFHSIYKNGRTMPLNKWLESETKQVCDGSRKTSKEYIAGFHVLESLEECREFSKKFYAPRDLVIVKCLAETLWPKTHSRANVMLAKKIKLLEVVEKININERVH